MVFLWTFLLSLALGALNAFFLSKKGYPFAYYFIFGTVGFFGLLTIILKFFK